MQKIKLDRTLMHRLPDGVEKNPADFAALLGRRIAYCDGVLAALHIVRSAPRRQRNAVIDALEEATSEIGSEAESRLSRMAMEIVAL